MVGARKLVVLFLFSILAGCVGGGPLSSDQSGAGSADGGNESWADGSPTDGADGGLELLFELPPDQAGEPELPVGPGCRPGDGCFLDKCQDNSSCDSGWCVQHLGESVCSQPCQDECPPGWSCRQVAGSDPDVVFICVSNHANLCRPCAAPSDCSGTGGAEDACLSYGAGGSFCGGGCGSGGECPWGFSCKEAQTVAGVMLKQCVADAGLCPCTDNSVELGLWTPCSVANDFGLCTGKRVCVAGGLSECDAATPATELCNGQDDDCDGAVDEPLEFGGDYINLCDDGNQCTKDLCAGEAGCQHQALTGDECKDGDLCTVNDHCEDGECVGTQVVCNDGNLCTDDSCDGAGGCLFVPNEIDCSDGDPCTVADRCQAGKCLGYPVSCDCQDDSDCGPLEDGDLCNGTLFCDQQGLPFKCALKPGSVVSCPAPAGADAPCLAALCDPVTGSCSLSAANDGKPCEEGNLCTLGDQCQAGKCLGGPELNCNDGNLCTDDSCLPAAGCLNLPGSKPCNDGNVCTTQDSCAAGSCTGGPPLACNDGNLCNGVESCDSLLGCVAGQPLACNDGNLCNGHESCQPATGCQPGLALTCNDGNECTDDSCDPVTGCLFKPNQLLCNDGNACTVGDLCVQGKCTGQATLSCTDDNLCTDDKCDTKQGCIFLLNKSPCNDGSLCTVNDFCHLGQCQGGGELVCDDLNPCTDDSCAPAVGCVHLANQAPCNDGNLCTIGDSCKGGICAAATMLVCDDSNPCTDDSCAPSVGCVNAFNQAPCNDDDICTTGDHCQQGLCLGAQPLDCDDSNPCTDDLCSALSGCYHLANQADCSDGSLCTTGDHCAQATCVTTGLLHCDDANGCTNDHCDPLLGCVYSANSQPCSDGNPCTQADQCAQGQCQPGAGVNCPDDGNSCTDEFCDPAQGCTFNLLPGCCGNGIPEAGEQCDDGDQQGGDGCSATCQNEGVLYLGFATWPQDCYAQTDEVMDQAMNQACKSKYGAAARAATNPELADKLIVGLPANNSSGDHLICRCPGCAGKTPWGGALSGHARACVDPGAAWPTALYPAGSWNPHCCNSSRATICVSG